MKTKLLTVLAIGLLLAACGGRQGASGQPEPAGAPAAREETGAAPAAAGSASGAEAGFAGAAGETAGEDGPFKLLEVRLTPEAPTASTAVAAVAVFAGSLPPDTDLAYEWVVNNNKVVDALSDTLAVEHFRKNDWISCRVAPVGPGGRGNEARSKFVRIGNTPPVLTVPPLEPLKAPGEFTCQLQAADADNDPLAFELVSPLDLGITLDAKTGLLRWAISPEAAKSLQEAVEIVFAVSDPDGGKTQSSLLLNLNPETN